MNENLRSVSVQIISAPFLLAESVLFIHLSACIDILVVNE